VRERLFRKGDHVLLVPPCEGYYRVLGIYCLEGSLPFVEVALMARGYDLPLPLPVISCMGTSELLETDLTDVIGPDMLENRITVTSLEDYND
jgi:hypothetical protein